MYRNGFSSFSDKWLPEVEDEMQAVLANDNALVAQHYRMMYYHLGWMDESFQPGRFPVGKRIRPLLCLLACDAVGGHLDQALPAAAGVELLHNFSLIHDDLEDGDETRRHRATVWKLWGPEQAINTGDGMFALSYAAVLRLSDRGVPAETVLAVLKQFTQTCIELTEGQHLDMSFEKRRRVTVEEYMHMIEGKTASLIAASLAMGARIGGADARQVDALYRFGRAIGLTFQIRDDILGIWGDPDVTGKPAGNDILRQKKSLPIIYTLNHPFVSPIFQSLWTRDITPKQLPQIMALLDTAGAREYAEKKLLEVHKSGVEALEEALGLQAHSSTLMSLADGLLQRQA